MSLTDYLFTPEGAEQNRLRCFRCTKAPVRPISTITVNGLVFNLCSNECAKECVANLRRNGVLGREEPRA